MRIKLVVLQRAENEFKETYDGPVNKLQIIFSNHECVDPDNDAKGIF